jgi:hypothetical protein
MVIGRMPGSLAKTMAWVEAAPRFAGAGDGEDGACAAAGAWGLVRPTGAGGYVVREAEGRGSCDVGEAVATVVAVGSAVASVMASGRGAAVGTSWDAETRAGAMAGRDAVGWAIDVSAIVGEKTAPPGRSWAETVAGRRAAVNGGVAEMSTVSPASGRAGTSDQGKRI